MHGPNDMNAQIKIAAETRKKIRVGKLRAKWSAAGDRILRYYIDFSHPVLDLHKEVSSPEIDILQNKVDVLLASWDKKYELHLKKMKISAGKETAEQLTLEAERQLTKLQKILAHTLSVDDTVNWEVLKDSSIFQVLNFEAEEFPTPKPMPPQETNSPELKIGWFEKLTGQSKKIIANHSLQMAEYKSKEKQKQAEYNECLLQWEHAKNKWDSEQEREKEEFQRSQNEIKKRFLKSQKHTNDKVDTLKQRWLEGSPEAIIEHANIVLDASQHDDLVPKDFDLEYKEELKTLVVEYLLPSPDDLPTVKSIRFVANSGELKETSISATAKKALYDDICYQLCLRTIHELFEADSPEHIDQIVFNGTAKYIDKGIGKEVHSTILSLMVSKEEFLNIDLSKVEPKTCFKSLKGVSASSLVGLSPVPPIIELEKVDKRFVEGREAAIQDDGSTNLAAMDWEEFEHLVREVFEKEFSQRGGEVKVTQSSSDGGVDAVAFDPDPISGGKIIIQAKRYTKTVGVSAVRDLYGTTMNEGANKGILVTTADYGPDAHKFAADKPLTLMTGANLLHLLDRHGIKAKIDIREARKVLGLR